jgi:hypothetical protein
MSHQEDEINPRVQKSGVAISVGRDLCPAEAGAPKIL